MLPYRNGLNKLRTKKENFRTMLVFSCHADEGQHPLVSAMVEMLKQVQHDRAKSFSILHF